MTETVRQKASVLGRNMLPPPDIEIDAGDRAHVAYMYAGLDYEGPAAPVVQDRRSGLSLSNGLTCFTGQTGNVGLTLIEGVTGYEGTAAAGYGTPDWSNYDGSSDGVENQLFTAGNFGPSIGISLNDTTFFAVTRNKGSSQRVFGVYTVSDDTITERSTLDMTADTGVQPAICKMTDTRILCAFTSNAQWGLYLINTSNLDSPAELDYDDGTGTIGSGENSLSLHKLTDTTAVACYDDDTGGGVHVCVIDISGDSISYGTPVDTTENTGNYSACTVLSSTLFVAASVDTVYLYSVSGTTITLEDSIGIHTSGAFDDMIGMVTIDSDTVLLLYEDDNAGTDVIYANTYSVSGGTTLSRGTRITVDSGTRHFGGPQGNKGLIVDDRTAMFVYTAQDVSFEDVEVHILSVDNSNVITLEASVVKSGIGDHPSIFMLEDTNNTRVVLITQDSTTTPADQITMIVLHGD